VLKRRGANDEGAVAVIIALITIPVLFGMGTLVVDVGSLYAERRELQNGADSAAYAVALNCARSVTGCLAATTTAQSKANANSNDTKSTIDAVCGGAAGLSTCGSSPCPQNPGPSLPASGTYTRVTTSTRTSDDQSVMPALLSRALGLSGSRVCAEAIVAWGAPAGGRTLPLTFSQCEFNRLVPTAVPADPGAGTVQLLFHDGNSADSCSAKNSGADAPGSFGFITPDSGSACEATVVNGLLPTSTGNSVPNNAVCRDRLDHRLQSAPDHLVNTLVLIPIYDDHCGPGDNVCISGNGNNVTYPILGFAEFFITGWSFNGQYYYPEGADRPCNGSTSCLAGYFVRFVDTSAALGTGPATYGVSAVKLIG
jgi:Flp pilus assembly protein TadG